MVKMSRKHGRGRWRRAQAFLSLLLGASTLLALGCGRLDRLPAARHLILVTVDTWRADHSFTERVGVPLTPRLEELAAESTRFSQASSVADETTPGVTGFLSGLVPHRSGVLVNNHVLPPALPTLATLLQAEGFHTRALVANPVLSPGNGFEHGFDKYRLLDPLGKRVKVHADSMTEAALHAVDRDLGSLEAGGRLFLWVHYLDPHGPYRPPKEFREMFPDDRFGSTPRPVPLLDRGDQSGKGGVAGYQQAGFRRPSEDARDYLGRYAAEVRFLDREVGRLIRGLRERGLLDASLLILTADHGEALEADHGFYFSHDNGQTADQIHVPLMIRCPGCPRGVVLDRPVSTVDVLPTALDLLGLDDLGHEVTTDGIDLLDDTTRLVVSQGLRQISVRRGRWKAIWSGGKKPRLYDLLDDPGEQHNLSAEHPDRLRRLRHAMRGVRARSIVARAMVRERAGKRLRESLHALGYL